MSLDEPPSMRSIIDNLDVVEAFVTRAATNAAIAGTSTSNDGRNTTVADGDEGSVSASGGLPLQTPRPVDEASVETLRDMAEDLLVRSHALRMENASLVGELTKLREELAAARRSASSPPHPPADHNDVPAAAAVLQSVEETVASQEKDSDGTATSFGRCVVDRLLSNADAQRAMDWVAAVETRLRLLAIAATPNSSDRRPSTGPSLTTTVVEKDGALHIVLAPPRRATAALRAKAAAGSASRTTALVAPVAVGVTPPSNKQRIATQSNGTSLALHAWGVGASSPPASHAVNNSAVVRAGASRSNTPNASSMGPRVASRPIARVGATTPVRTATTGGTSVAGGRTGSPSIGSMAPSLKSRSPVVTRRPAAATPVLRRATPSTAAGTETRGSPVARRTSASALQQCAAGLRKGSAGISRFTSATRRITPETSPAAPTSDKDDATRHDGPAPAAVAQSTGAARGE